MESSFTKVELCELASIKSGYAFKSRDWIDEGVPVVKIANVKDGEIILDGCSYLPEDYLSQYQDFVLRPGDMVMAMTGYVGEVGLVRDSEPIFLNQRVGRFTVTQLENLDKKYLYYFLRHPDTKHGMEQRAYGSAQPNISPKLILSVEIPLPSLPEQQAIAEILGALDDKIELNRKMNATLDELARTIFRSWFVDFDPVRAKMESREPFGMDADTANRFPDRLIDSPLGPIPEGWEAATLGDIVDVVDCLHSKKPERRAEGWPLLQLSNIRDDGLLDVVDQYLISEEDYTRWISRIEASEGDCVITNVGRVGAVSQVPAGVRAALGRNMTGLRSKEYL
jgi:type I restriction enzyme S subunit